jgi:membrane-bound serine protease (ClpP class)
MQFVQAVALALVGLGTLVSAPLRSQGAAAPAAPRAIVAEYDGIIHPIAAEIVDQAISRADATGAAVTVIVLRTPGGLLESTRTIISRMIAARAPVVLFVGPAGARAASAGFIIVLAADVAVMAPGTHIGAAHPVTAGGEPAGGEPAGGVMEKKATSDAAAYARTLASARGRNAALAAEAVTESRSFTDREALEATPPLVDFAAGDVHEVLRKLDGRTVRRMDGHSVTLHTAGITIDRVEMTRRQQLLSAIANPQIAYLLLTLGMLGLTVELWTPGAILPGVAGGLCLLLAFFAFQVLPVNAVGVLLIVFGVGLLVLELKVPSFGALGIGGTVSLLVGSIMLTNDVPGVRVGYGVILPVVVAFASIILFLGRLAMASQRMRPITGVEGLVGERGGTLTGIAPGAPGQVRVHGEIWRATSTVPLDAGRPVRVNGVDGLTLQVEPMDQLQTGEP